MVSTSSLLYCAWIVRYKGHKGSEYNIDSALTHNDACVVSGSEDGKIYFWELVEVISVVREGGLCDWCVPTVECCGTDITATRRKREGQLCGLLTLLPSQQAVPTDSRVSWPSEGKEERS